MISKSISQAWDMLKKYKKVPSGILFEKQIGLAILAALIGFVSVKNGRKEAALKKAQKTKILEQ